MQFFHLFGLYIQIDLSPEMWTLFKSKD